MLGLNRTKWDNTFGIYVASGLNLLPTVAYCLMNGADDASRCEKLLELRYLAEPAESINHIVDSEGVWKKRADTIHRWLAEFQLHHWIQHLNKDTGITPSYDAAFDKFCNLSSNTLMEPQQYTRREARGVWSRRFMQKWKIHRGTMTTHEAENLAEVVDIVRNTPQRFSERSTR